MQHDLIWEETDNVLLSELTRQRKELMDSIRYAGYIQKAMLPDLNYFKKLIPESFIYFNPREIVSGDFYWISKAKGWVILAVTDCTGHGVPGGFMSVLGISFLNDIMGKGCFSNAAAILNQLRERVMKALHQTGDWNEQKDGMDISLVIIDPAKQELQYAGANNPLYLFREGSLMEFKPDHMPIGISAIQEKSFTNHIVDIQPGDVVYLFTDGFIDQFGGPYGKKIKYHRFKQLLQSVYFHPIEIHKEMLHSHLVQWMGSNHQVDDILVVGFHPFSACK